MRTPLERFLNYKEIMKRAKETRRRKKYPHLIEKDKRKRQAAAEAEVFIQNKINKISIEEV